MPCQQFVNHDANRVQIGTFSRALPAYDFRREISQRPGDLILRFLSLFMKYGETKIKNLHLTIGYQNVRGFEVTVDNAAPMQIGNRLEHLHDEFNARFERLLAS